MAISKVILNGVTQMDITDTTATAEDVANGKVFYGADGNRTTGTASGLPSTYQRVEYLGATEQCFFSLGARSYATFGFEITYYIESRYASVGPHILSDTTEYLWFATRQTDTMLKWGGTETLISVSPPLNLRNYASFNTDETNRIDMAGMASDTLSKGTNTYGDVYLLCYGGRPTERRYHLNGKLYYVRFYNNGNIVEDFVPCYRKSDSVPGLYDIVNQIFYTNAGSGSFTVGRDVS